uniref:ARAD1C06754p n=1 Tax=Blastobotrys adeninivorans TaxID=409370 RepID=A0A060T4Y2_BLAAD
MISLSIAEQAETGEMSERDLAEFEAQTRRNQDSRASSERSERRREGSRDRHKSHHRHHHRHHEHREHRDDRDRRHRHHSRGERDHHSRDHHSREHRRSRHNRDRHERESEERRTRDRSQSPVRTVPEHSQQQQQEEEEEEEEEEWVVTADTGEFYDSLGPDWGQEHQPVVDASELSEEVSVSRLNKLKAEIMKAEIRGDRFVAEKLQSTYDQLANSQAKGVERGENESENDDNNAEIQEKQENDGEKDNVKVIDRRFQQTRPKTSGEEMTIQDMLREELETRGSGDLLGKQLASRIGRDSGFDSSDLDYQDERAGELAQVDLQKSEQAARNSAIARTQQLYAAIDACPLCMEGMEGSKKLTVIAHGYRVLIAMAPIPVITKGAIAIVPKDHKKNTLECDDDEWEEIRNFMKSLAKMWYDQGKGILFYESAIDRSVRAHACIMAVPVPLNLANTAPGFFREAIMAADDEWSDHQKIIDTAKAAKEGKGRLAFRTSIAKQAPYFHVWFNIDGGYGHIVENSRKWPPGDMFAREVIGGMVQADPAIIKKLPVWKRHDKTRMYLEDLFMPYDWTEDLDT